MSRKKTVWLEVQADESIADCMQRLEREGYTIAGRREEPLFKEINGEIKPIRQIIQLKGILIDKK